MKTLFLLIASVCFITTSYAQNTQPGCYPFPKTISVTGSAEMDIIPDEIYVQVNLREYKKKGEEKKELEKIKAEFLANCRSAGILDSNVSLASYDGYNLSAIWRRRKKDPDLMASIVYQLKFNNTKKIDELVEKLDDEATGNFSIVRTSHSKITEYRKQLKIMATKAAKEKATYLCESINEQLGQAITIVEPQEYTSSDVSERSKSSNAYLMKEEKGSYDVNSDVSTIDYRKIKLRFEVKILYALK